MPYLAKRLMEKEMWDTLKKLLESKNENPKMAITDKLHSTRMAKGESVSFYLTIMAQVKDKIEVVG